MNTQILLRFASRTSTTIWPSPLTSIRRSETTWLLPPRLGAGFSETRLDDRDEVRTLFVFAPVHFFGRLVGLRAKNITLRDRQVDLVHLGGGGNIVNSRYDHGWNPAWHAEVGWKLPTEDRDLIDQGQAYFSMAPVLVAPNTLMLEVTSPTPLGEDEGFEAVFDEVGEAAVIRP